MNRIFTIGIYRENTGARRMLIKFKLPNLDEIIPRLQKPEKIRKC